ncbi:hypothetical protein WR25_04747 [Diploscapter pachys]|uniref:Uncharacterized protein n=1 Tax=Diploscapter pachys TaxID=2018661 RepID=A0A2A2KHR0_9BILA|nr:hypothetical protein WR25_04747 [Diploscapter pachys]
MTWDACSSAISASNRCSSVAYSCRREDAASSALCSVVSSAGAKDGIQLTPVGPDRDARPFPPMSVSLGRASSGGRHTGQGWREPDPVRASLIAGIARRRLRDG